MELRSALNYKLKQQQQLALIEFAIMLLLPMVQQQLMHQHLLAKLIYQHAFGMEIQDVQVEDAQHISDYNQPAVLSQQLEYLVGHYQQLELMLHVLIKIVLMLQQL